MKNQTIAALMGTVLIVGGGLHLPAAQAADVSQSTPTTPATPAAPAAPATPTSPTSPTANWQPFSSKVGGFTVQMPGQPKEEVERGSKPNESDTYSYILDKGNSAYFISYYDLPNTIPAGKTREFFDSVRDGAVRGSKARVLNERDVRLDNQHSGRQVRYVDSEGVTYHMRLYLVNKRLYLTLVAIAQGENTKLTPDADRFLNSFKLL